MPLLLLMLLSGAAIADDAIADDAVADDATADDATADDPQTDTAAVDTDTASDDGRSWMVLPGAFYSQETSVGFAAYGSATFPVRGTGDATWPSTVSAALVYTLRKQASLAVWPTLYLGRDNTWIADGEYIISHYPTRWFGIGPDTDPTWQSFTRRWLLTRSRLLHRVSGPFYVGVVDSFSVTGLRDFSDPMVDNGQPATWTDADPLGSGRVPGEDGGIVHGLGLALRHERRDNDQSTRRGTLVDLSMVGHAPALGSDHGYTQATVDLRAFHTFPHDWTIAGQWLTELGTGDVPFTHMAQLGGDNVLRGMYEGRFRDRSLTAVQGELRFPIIWRFRGVAFADAGQVFSDPGDLLATAPRWTAGGGLRFELDEVSHSTIRLDFGGGPDGLGFIFTFGEAF